MLKHFKICCLIVCCQAVSAQSEISPEHIDALILQLSSADSHARESAINELEQIGPPARKAVPALEALGDQNRRAVSARRRIGPGPEPFPHRIYSEVLPGGDPHVERCQYYIHIDNTKQDIALGTTREFVGEDRFLHGEKEGLDQESILVRWLAPDRLLHIQWTTLAVGNGGYQAQGNIVLNNSDGVWRELLRDSREYYYSGGASDNYRLMLAFGWDSERRRLHLTQTDFINASYGLSGPGPLLNSYTGPGRDPDYWRSYRVEKSWTAAIEADALVFDHGEIALGLPPETNREQWDKPSFTVAQAAEFVAQSSDFSTNRSAAEQVHYFLQRNPDLRADSNCPERLLVSAGIPPFEPSATEMLRTGDNTSW